MTDGANRADAPETTEIAPAEPQSIERRSAGPLDAILADPRQLRDLPIEIVERLYELHERDQQRGAEREFNAAFNRVQAAVRPVLKRGDNQQTRSRYALLEDVIAELRPRLVSEGFSWSTSTRETPEDGMVLVVLRLRHVGGHAEEHSMSAPIDNLGPKGAPVKTKLHGMGSTYSYASRYLLVNVFGIQTTLDADGNRPVNLDPITEDQARDMEALISEVGADRAAFLQWLQVDSVEAIPVSLHRKAVHGLERKRAR